MSRAVGSALALLVATLIALLPRAARADEEESLSVFVLTIWTNDADDQADALTAALRARVKKAPGWVLTDASQSFETLAIALKCPPLPNRSCLQRIGDQLHADRYVWGTMGKEKDGEVTADMHLWTRGKPPIEASETYPEELKDPGSDGLRAVADRLFRRLTAGEGGSAASGEAAAEGARPAPSELDKVDRGPEVSSGPSPVRKIVAYSALVAGAGLLVAGGVEGLGWLSDKHASDTDRAAVPQSVTDVCASPPVNPAAADACQKSQDASKAATLGWVFTGAGAVLAGTGLVLLLTDHGGGEDTSASARSRLAVAPVVGPRSGGLQARFAF
jgi:hypothetical protein